MVPRVIWAGAAFRTVPWVGPFVGRDHIDDRIGVHLSALSTTIMPVGYSIMCLMENGIFFKLSDPSTP